MESWLEMPSPSCIVSRALLWGEREEIQPGWGLWGRFGEVEQAGVCQSQAPIKPCLLSLVLCCTPCCSRSLRGVTAPAPVQGSGTMCTGAYWHAGIKHPR